MQVTLLRNSMFSAVAQSTKRLVRFRVRFVDIQNVCTQRRACFSNGVRSDEGPLRLYKSYLEKQLLKPDDSQSKVVYQLQGLYERLKDYDPQQKSSKLHIDLVYVNCLFLSIPVLNLEISQSGHMFLMTSQIAGRGRQTMILKL